MKVPKWFSGGAFTPTAVATFFSLVAAPIGGIGVIALMFGAWVPGLVFAASGAALWLVGKYLIDR